VRVLFLELGLTVLAFWLCARVFCWLIEATIGRTIGHPDDIAQIERQSPLSKSDNLPNPK
jgi:hypothetical protein